ncbi:MAG TPA: SAM-dependent methyltransferase [Candidatus Stackebrandtia excrementipullorum]|nr:SAM-dependent methyltransferase [Candidatus Stackebrandtia excrementipullorum]
MRTGLYDTTGFYRRNSPAAHFRTSAQIPLFADAIATLIRRVDAALGHPSTFTVVDMGAGNGELLTGLVRIAPLNGRLKPVAVDIRGRPESLDPSIRWCDEPPTDFTGVLLACEWLDNVPCDIVEETENGPRYQLVSPRTGETTLGGPLSELDRDWLDRRWRLAHIGDQAEIGRPRDEAWRELTSRLDNGLALAVDYGHRRHERPQWSTVAGYVDGRRVSATPDGNRDITADVAMDSLGPGVLLRQRDALAALGVSASRPPLDVARTDPAAYLRRLSGTGDAAELMDRNGLGGHWWLTRGMGIADDVWAAP